MNLRLPLLCALLAQCAVPACAFDDINFLPAVGLETLSRPGAAAASPTRTYVVDEKKYTVSIYGADGKWIKTVGHSGSGKDQFYEPSGLAVASDGRVYVADTGNSRIQILSADGDFLGFFGVRGSALGQVKSPESVSVGADGRVYVADTGNDRVDVFTDDGIFLYAVGEKGKFDGQFRGPTRVAVDPGDNVYVLDSGNGRIQKFNAAAKYQSQVNLEGSDFLVDAYGFYYVLDPKAYKVREYDPSGAPQGVFGSKGSGEGQFKYAQNIGLAPDGTILLVDQGQKRLISVRLASKLKLEPVAPNPEARLMVSGPVSAWKGQATALAADQDAAFAYMSKEGKFESLEKDGKTGLSFGKQGKSESSTRGSQGFAASDKYGFYVADTDGDKLQHFDAKGAFVSAFGSSSGFFDSKKKEGRVKWPHGIAVDGNGKVYAANTGDHRVEVFNKQGAYLFSIGPNVGGFELKDPVGVAWDSAGFLYILDKTLKKVIKCEPSGGFLLAWGVDGNGPGEFVDPTAIAFDGLSYVYVLDHGAGRVAVFSQDGTWVTNFFAQGTDDRSLQDPSGIAIQGNQLFVSDLGKDKISAFSLRPRLAPPLALTSSVTEGVVTLKWKAAPNAWADGYQVFRSTMARGPYALLASTAKTEYQDSSVETYQTYYYRVATAAKTKEAGVPTEPTAVLVPGQFNRAPVEISSVDIGNIFSASYKYYEKNPVGTLVLVNNVNVPFENVKVTFRLKDFMDFGTDTVIPKLAPQERKEIPLMAVLNNRILDVTEDTPIQAEFTLTYYESGKVQTVSLAKPLRVYSRNAITWDKPERLAAFVTVNDTPIKDFERQVLTAAPADSSKAELLPESLVSAVRLWNALGSMGVKFQQAPNNPFEDMAVNPAFPVDSTQFPRETLKRKSGQCDDLSTLIASLFESAGIRTAFLNYPGHIAVMFDTGVNDPLLAGLPESEMIQYDGTYWVPVEATLVGSSFVDVQHHAINGYHEMDEKGKASIIDPRKAWAEFEPVTMPATDWSAAAPKAEEVSKRADADIAEYAKERYEFLHKHWSGLAAKDGKDAEPVLQLGILDLEYGKADRAVEEFQKVLALDANNAAALNDLGSAAFLGGDYAKAQTWFEKAAKADGNDPGIWLNLAKTAAKTKNKEKIKEYGAKAVALDSGYTTAVETLSR